MTPLPGSEWKRLTCEQKKRSRLMYEWEKFQNIITPQIYNKWSNKFSYLIDFINIAVEYLLYITSFTKLFSITLTYWIIW